MKSFWMCLFLSGCAMFVDLRPETMHKEWLRYQRGFIGLNIYECSLGFCGKNKKTYSWGSAYLGDEAVGEGFLERGFRYGRYDAENPSQYRQCRFFFKFDGETGLITNFRFEEAEPLACRYSGA